MCDGCWVAEGSPSEWTDQTESLLGLIDELYIQDGCGTGGPIHVVVDDWNVEDHSLADMPPENLRDDYDADTWALCEQIIEIMQGMTEAQRNAALAYRNGLLARPATR